MVHPKSLNFSFQWQNVRLSVVIFSSSILLRSPRLSFISVIGKYVLRTSVVPLMYLVTGTILIKKKKIIKKQKQKKHWFDLRLILPRQIGLLLLEGKFKPQGV